MGKTMVKIKCIKCKELIHENNYSNKKLDMCFNCIDDMIEKGFFKLDKIITLNKNIFKEGKWIIYEGKPMIMESILENRIIKCFTLKKSECLKVYNVENFYIDFANVDKIKEIDVNE